VVVLEEIDTGKGYTGGRGRRFRFLLMQAKRDLSKRKRERKKREEPRRGI